MIEVAAGVLSDTQGRVLLMQRLPGTHLAGLWEFPGGKLEPGESVTQALARELREELGIEVRASEPLISIPWRYPEKSVRLHALRVTAWHGAPQAREGHPLRWEHVRDMDAAAMPAADAPIVAALRLPACYVISENARTGFARRYLRHAGSASARCVIRGLQDTHAPARGRSTPHAQGAARLSPSSPGSPGGEGCGEGAACVGSLHQLRRPGASSADVRRVAVAWLDAEPSLHGRLLLNHDIDLARELGVGVHLRAVQLRELRERPLPSGAWVCASCHDAAELELAARLGADFATLSPVCATVSHPDAMPLGWARFARLVADARLPVYALGGVGPDDLERARAAGAQGIAGIRAFNMAM